MVAYLVKEIYALEIDLGISWGLSSWQG